MQKRAAFFMTKTLGRCPKPRELLKKLDQNFNKKAANAAFLVVFVKLFSKRLWGLGQRPKVLTLIM